MLPVSLVILWISVFSFMSLLFMMWALMILPAGKIKTLFLAFLIPYIAWGESLLLIQLLGAEHPFSRPVSQMIFMCGGFFHGALGTFFLEFAEPESSGNRWIKAFLGVVIGVSSLAPFGLLEKGVRFTEDGGLFPIEGPLFSLFNVVLLTWGVFYLYRIRAAYAKLPKLSFVRVQLQFLATPAMWAIGATLVTNVVIPGVGGTFALTPLAAFWIFMFLVSVGYTVSKGKVLVLRESARRFDAIACDITQPSLVETADTFSRFVGPVVVATARSRTEIGAQRIRSEILK